METFYHDAEKKRKEQKMRLQTDQKFKQRKTFDLNNKYNIDLFSTAVRVGKAFAAEQKLRKLKKGYQNLRLLKKNRPKNKSVPNNYKICGKHEQFTKSKIQTSSK